MSMLEQISGMSGRKIHYRRNEDKGNIWGRRGIVMGI